MKEIYSFDLDPRILNALTEISKKHETTVDDLLDAGIHHLAILLSFIFMNLPDESKRELHPRQMPLVFKLNDARLNVSITKPYIDALKEE